MNRGSWTFMRYAIPALPLIFVLGIAEARSDENTEPFSELGESVASSIRNADIVEYASCWLSWRAGKAAADKSSGNPGTPRSTGPRTYIRRRNQEIAASFAAIERMLEKHDIERQSVTLSSVHVRRDEDREGRIHDFTLTLETNAGQVKLDIDDGALVDGLWHFTDAPTALSFDGREQWRADGPYRHRRAKRDPETAVKEVTTEP